MACETSGPFRAVVDYSQYFRLAIAEGEYDWSNYNNTHMNSCANERGTVEVDLELLRFYQRMTSEEARREYERLGYRSANHRELFAFGHTYKNKQREFSIVALGPFCAAVYDWHIPFLGGNSTERYLAIDWFPREWMWNSFYQFLVVRK